MRPSSLPNTVFHHQLDLLPTPEQKGEAVVIRKSDNTEPGLKRRCALVQLRSWLTLLLNTSDETTLQGQPQRASRTRADMCKINNFHGIHPVRVLTIARTALQLELMAPSLVHRCAH